MGITMFAARGTIYTHTNRMVTETCYKCHVLFGMTEEQHDLCLERGYSFFCPNGHSQCFCESREQKLEKELRTAEQSRDTYNRWYDEEVKDHKTTMKQRNAHKGQVTKIKRRVSNGVCPCCNRTFENLARHMQSKHPDYVEPQEKPETV